MCHCVGVSDTRPPGALRPRVFVQPRDLLCKRGFLCKAPLATDFPGTRNEDDMSDEPKKRWRAIRLALSMLAGVWIGYVLSPRPGNALDHWDRAPPEIYTVGGALIGLAIGMALNSRANRQKPGFKHGHYPRWNRQNDGMSDEPKRRSWAWATWSNAIGLFLLGLLMLLFARECARSDRLCRPLWHAEKCETEIRLLGALAGRQTGRPPRDRVPLYS
jgi:hypothetical protein